MNELFTVEQIAAILQQVSRKTIKDWLRTGKLSGCKIGRLWRVKAPDLEGFIQASRRWYGREEPTHFRHDR
jgi:excisionase family DNA binding protein